MHILVNDNFSHITGYELQQMIESLPAWRREQALKFRFEQGRRECALSYIMLADCLGKEYGITEPLEFEYGDHGKPSLKGHPDIHFNISHCKNAIAVAVSDSPIGIDVERLGRYDDSVARYAMNDEEIQTILMSENREIAFTRLWTMKESVLKLTGEGINDDIKSVLNNLTDIKIETQDNSDKCYVLSVATKP